jgi:hypothetical protein
MTPSCWSPSCTPPTWRTPSGVGWPRARRKRKTPGDSDASGIQPAVSPGDAGCRVARAGRKRGLHRHLLLNPRSPGKNRPPRQAPLPLRQQPPRRQRPSAWLHKLVCVIRMGFGGRARRERRRYSSNNDTASNAAIAPKATEERVRICAIKHYKPSAPSCFAWNSSGPSSLNPPQNPPLPKAFSEKPSCSCSCSCSCLSSSS